MRYRVLWCATVCRMCFSEQQCVAVWCSVMQCVAVWCSVIQCEAAWCSGRGLGLRVLAKDVHSIVQKFEVRWARACKWITCMCDMTHSCVWQMNASCHTYECVMTHVKKRNNTHMNEARQTHEWAMSNVRKTSHDVDSVVSTSGN